LTSCHLDGHVNEIRDSKTLLLRNICLILWDHQMSDSTAPGGPSTAVAATPDSTDHTPTAASATTTTTAAAAAASDPPRAETVERDSSTKSTEASETEESSASDGEDSDYSSEDIDVDECDARRDECVTVMSDIERQFSGLKEQLYRERHEQIELKLSQVRAGRSSEYVGPLQKLEENMQIRRQVAGVLKGFRTTALETKMEAESLAGKQNLESEKMIIYDSLKEDFQEKIRRLEEDRHNLVTSDLWQETKKNGRKSRTEGGPGEKRKKAVSVTGPFLVYMLSEADIIEDWTIIKKSVIAQQQQQQQQQMNNRCNPGSSANKRTKSADVPHSVY